MLLHQLLSLPPALLAVVATFALAAHAQYPPPASYQNILRSPIDPEVTVAYKQPANGTCTTAFETQKQYTGYIGLPPYTLAPIQQNYSINTFFWFIEARQTPESAPLTIWLNGGPGSSSLFGMFNEVGPCEVVQLADGTYGTQMRTFGWDRISNILFIDQPNQVGLSYDSATNASLNLYTGQIFEPPTDPVQDLPSFMYLNGTFGTANENSETAYATTANTSEIAAAATWHFLQTWLSTFSQYNPATRPNVTTPNSDEPAGIHLFTESYGGKYGPVFATYFEEQNAKIYDGQLSANETLPIKLQSLGIVNGLVDDLIQDYHYPYFAFNNTYNTRLIDQTTQLNAINNFTRQCEPAILACRNATQDLYGNDDATNELCEDALYTCNNLTALAVGAGYNTYDIRQKLPSPDPPTAYVEYLNNGSTLESIGARVNYTESSRYVQAGFVSTGDTIRGGAIKDLADLLKLGVRVAFIYGDADYICNWFGGQAVAYAVANELPSYPYATSVSPSGAGLPPSYADGFNRAGFAEIVVNDSYVGGAVRQYANLSFSRVYDAGHFVPFYQPETAFQIFARVILGNDISTGTDIDLGSFVSNGTANATHTNKVPDAPKATCWIRNFASSCTDEDTRAMQEGKGVVEYGMYYQNSKDISLPKTTVMAGVPGIPLKTTSSGSSRSSTGSTVALTGVYTATGTPSGAASRPLTPIGDEMALGQVAIMLAGIGVGAVIML
ncbi:Putative peptidase S10, serine carboxypeptidase, alpha/Beta hydrolase [Septoria linicola]|uniref:Peptidase S10, serine carboxypeptidase, alpha/Beta hydrolase n=1 Tax=Septoria linicola TaxID=215465 RepID=A0A9Q9AU99_9PEZI|nr:Putative peptidase S10, serine carboxypeptidase, alpha/Beta hydrolase [Septoria linicola]